MREMLLMTDIYEPSSGFQISRKAFYFRPKKICITEVKNEEKDNDVFNC